LPFLLKHLFASEVGTEAGSLTGNTGAPYRWPASSTFQRRA